MRISGQPGNVDPQALTDGRVSSQPPRAESGAEALAGSSATPSRDARIDERTLNLIREAARHGDDVRQDKVAELRAALRDGSYSVTDQQIAGAMLNELGR